MKLFITKVYIIPRLTLSLTRKNNKQVDLSRTFRLAGLTSGAKLELVQLSRSASVVSVALQLPDSEVKEGGSNRLVDKFPSTTTLWLVLRKFEAGAAGGGNDGSARFNITARGVPKLNDAETDGGAGRLFYETPVLHVMGRDLSSFTDLQKTLGQLGFNGGSALIRLNFQATDQPLEDAMKEIDGYFKSVEGQVNEGVHSGSVGQAESAVSTVDAKATSPGDKATPALKTSDDTAEKLNDTREDEAPTPPSNVQSGSPNTITGPGSRPITVYQPPGDDVPKAALRPHKEADYIPSQAQISTHQSRLQTQTRNTRLLSDAELATQSSSNPQPSASSVEIKLRYPDQSTLVSTFATPDTASILHDFVRSTLEDEHAGFMLSYMGRSGLKVLPRNDARLIADVGMTGRVLVNINYNLQTSSSSSSPAVSSSGDAGTGYKSAAEAAAAVSEQKAIKLPSLRLKQEYRDKARKIEVEDVPDVDEDETGDNEKGGDAKDESKRSGGGGRGMPKWLKLPGKK